MRFKTDKFEMEGTLAEIESVIARFKVLEVRKPEVN